MVLFKLAAQKSVKMWSKATEVCNCVLQKKNWFIMIYQGFLKYINHQTGRTCRTYLKVSHGQTWSLLNNLSFHSFGNIKITFNVYSIEHFFTLSENSRIWRLCPFQGPPFQETWRAPYTFLLSHFSALTNLLAFVVTPDKFVYTWFLSFLFVYDQKSRINVHAVMCIVKTVQRLQTRNSAVNQNYGKPSTNFHPENSTRC